MTKDPTRSGARQDSDGASTLDLSGRCVGSSYILVKPIGHGATGTVWRGVDRASGEQVALKLLHESLLRQPKLVTRFVQERTILMMLRHRNVVRVRDLFSVGESLGLVMDLVPGGSLREHLREHHTVPAGEAARLAAQVAAALAEAHELGIVHRDLKPDNILLQTEDGQLDTRLTDFGIARVLSTPSLTTPNAVVGTPHYMSPEAFHGATASPAADVYALGVLLYELVTGRPPYDSDSVPDLMRQHLEGNPERPPGILEALWDAIMSCLAQKPRLRPTAGELVAELSGIARSAAGAPALPRPEPREASKNGSDPDPDPAHPSQIIPAPRVPLRRNQAPSWRWARPGGAFAILAGAMLASGVATTAWHLGRSDDEPRATAAAAAPTPHTSRSRTVRSSAPPPVTTTRSAAAPQPPPSTVQAAAEQTDSVRPAATVRVPARKQPVPERQPYGPMECGRVFTLGAGTNPFLAGACQSVGTDVQMKATLTAAAGGRATLTVALQENGRRVAGPYTCPGLGFTEDDLTQECGPSSVAVRKGHRYAVQMTWSYTRDGRSSSGRTTGSEFTF